MAAASVVKSVAHHGEAVTAKASGLPHLNASTGAAVTVTGVKAGGTALVNLIAELVRIGLITDATT